MTRPHTDQPTGWWTTIELADYLSVSTQYLERLRRRGEGPPWFRVGRYVRYDVAAVEAWIEANTVPPLVDNNSSTD